MKQSMKKLALASSLLFSLSLALPMSPITYADTYQPGQVSQEDVVQTLVNQGYLERDTLSQTIKITEKYKQEILSKTDLSLYRVVFTENSVAVVPKYQERSFSGVNKIVYTWKGFDLYLDSTNTNRLGAGLVMSAAASTLIPDPTASKWLAAAMGLASGLVYYNNAAGRGVIISYIGRLPNAYVHWVSSQ